MNKLHIFHHNDADGRLSAAIVVHALREAAGHPQTFDFCAYEMGYETKPDFTSIASGDTVYIVDFSFKDDVFDQLRATGASLIWIDHHKACADSKHLDLPGIRRFENKGPAACALTWNWFYPFTTMPDIVEHVSDYDSWAHKHPASTAIYEATKADPQLQTVAGWLPTLTTGKYYADFLAERGAAMIDYRNGYCSNLRKLYGYRVSLWDPRWYAGGLAGLKETTVVLGGTELPASACACSYALNAQNFGSMAFGEELMNEYPFVIAYIHNGKEFVCSLYSTNPTIDCSEIAKAFGGGGHKGAAGFRCNELPWQVSRYTTRVVDIEYERARA